MKKQTNKPGLSRRTFIKTIGLAGGTIVLRGPGGLAQARAQVVPGGSLDPTSIPKYKSPLFRFPAMPPISNSGQFDYYEVAIRQVQQQILPAGLPPTTVWAYGSANSPGTFHTPSFKFETTVGRPVRVKWINDLKDPATGRYLPSFLKVDPTLHWADPPDLGPTLPGSYRGPVPDVTHLHGAHSDEESDGYPEAWYLPNAKLIPASYLREGPYYKPFKDIFSKKYGVAWEPGTAVFQYRNDQRATALWFHAHALGVTRLNMYAGLAGMYFLRGGEGDPFGGTLPSGNYEVPLVIQDRCFNTDGSLFYPDNRAFFDGFTGPYAPSPLSDIAPYWNPEVFGNTMVVNGNTWPYMNTERRRYRFRILNACNARVVLLKLADASGNGLDMWQIGADGGCLTEPVQLNQVMLAPSERADVIVDFSGLEAGQRAYLVNVGPDEPFGGGTPGVDFAESDPGTTGQVMEFRVVPASSSDYTSPPSRLRLPQPPQMGPEDFTRRISFNELESNILPGVGPRIGLLGQVDLSDPAAPAGLPMRWMDAVTETPTVDSTEVWEIYDFTEDAHPFHLHQVEFEILDRRPIDPTMGGARGPEPWETGRKDTVIIYPGEITRVKAHFDIVGRYVWHCHMVEHEDNEMMRPCEVLPAT